VSVFERQGGMHREPGDNPCRGCRLVLDDDDKLKLIAKLDPVWLPIATSPSLRVKTTALAPTATFAAKPTNASPHAPPPFPPST
jgi:hypothetical protein